MDLARLRQDHREADAVDGQAVAGRQLAARAASRCAARTPPLVGLHSTSFADRFNEAREHNLRSAHPDRAARSARSNKRRRRKRPPVEKPQAARTEHVRRHVEPHEVDHALRPTPPGASRRRLRAAASRSAALPRHVERGAERAVRGDLDLGAARLEAPAHVRSSRAGRRRHDDDRAGVTCREHARVGRRPQTAVEDDARQRALAIGAARASAADRRRGPCRRRRRSRRPRRERAARGGSPRPRSARAPPGRLRDAAVEADRRLQHDERPPLPHQREERLVQRRSPSPRRGRPRRPRRAPRDRRTPGRARADSDPRPRATTRAMPASTIRTTHGPGPSDVAARLERAVERRARAPVARHRRARATSACALAGALVEALADDDAVGRHDDRADHRVRTRAPAPPRGVKQRALHVVGCASGRHHFSSNRPSTYSLASRTARGRRSPRRRRRSESAASDRGRSRRRRRPSPCRRASSARCRSRRRRS